MIALLLLTSFAWATKLAGYEKTPGTDTVTYVENVERLEETSKELLVLINHHDALFAVPKGKHDQEFRDFVHAKIKAKTPATVVVDPLRSRIISIAD